MPSVLLAGLSGLALGLSLAGPPGPVNALIARRASAQGVRAGVLAGLPAPIVDTTYMLLVLLGVRSLELGQVLPWLSVAGALVMAYLAWMIWREGRRTQGTPPRALAGAWAVWAVTITNPFQYAWWLSAGATFVAQAGLPGVVGFLVAIFGWVFLFSWLVHKGAGRWTWFVPAIRWVSVAVLGLFSALLLANGVRGLLQHQR